MSLRPDPPRGGDRAARRWPDLLLGVLLPLAALLPLLDGLAVHRAWGLVPWGLAAAALAAALGWRRRAAADLPGRERDVVAAEFRLLLLAVAGVHLAAAATGGAPAPAAAAYATLLLLAAARLPGWWRPFSCWAAVALFETGHLALQRVAPPPGGATPPLSAWLAALAALGTLGLLALLAGSLFRRGREERAALQGAIDKFDRLRNEAEEYRALGDQRREPAAEDLSPRVKDTRVMSAVVGLDGGLDRLLGLARIALAARGVLLFVHDGDPDLLPLRWASTGKGAPEVDPGAAVRVGEGVVGHAAKTRRPALFTDLDPGSVTPGLYLDGEPSPSLVVVPVQEDGVFRGVLTADAPAPGAFGREHERLLEGFAAEVGALLASARSDARRERRSHRLEALGHIVQELSSTIKLDEVLAKMVDLAREAVPYDRCALFLADPAGRRLLLKAQRGFRVPEGEETTVAWDYGLPGYIALHGRPMLFSNLKERERGVEIVPGAPGQERIRSFLGLPVRGQDSLVGVWVLAAEEPGRFSAEDLEILSVVAAQAGIIIANASLHQAVERMAVTDGLTGLYNHRHFQERLGHEIERAARTGEAVSLLLMDIDHFKKINDAHGHPFGDRVLKALARELGRLARRVDVVARYGGEEFALVLVDTDRRGCRTTVARVLKAVRGIRIPLEGGVFTFTASIGAATCPDDAKSREDLVRLADQALYAAKEAGRNQARAAGEVAAA